MKLFHRQNQAAEPSPTEGPQQSSPAPDEPVQDNQRASALRLAVMAAVIAAVVLAVLLVLRSPQTPTGKKITQKPGTNQTAANQKSAPGKKATPTSSNPKQSTSPTATAQPPAGPSGQLSNTGPGDVAAWFVITSLAATGLSYFVILRRLDTADNPKI